MRVTFDGEEIIDVEPIFGYLHRGSEKLAEERTYVQVVTLTDRMDYVGSMLNNQAYMLAVEKLADVEPAPRGVWLRMIASELQRIASHLVAVGFLIQDLGAWGTPLIYTMREREKILDLFEMLLRRANYKLVPASRRRLHGRARRILASNERSARRVAAAHRRPR